MYPNASYFFYDLFGVAPDNFLSVFQTFGMFLVLAFIASAYVLKLELTRKYKEGLLHSITNKITKNKPPTLLQMATSIVITAVLTSKFFYIVYRFSEFQASAADVIISMKGSLIGLILGAVVKGYLEYRNYKKLSSLPQTKSAITLKPQDRVWDITIISAISGIIGAKLFAIFESAETISYFLDAPIQTIFSGSGLAIYGGLILAFIVVFYYLKKINLTPIHVIDAAAPAMIMGYAVGRLGCQFSGDGDWGIVNNNPQPSWWFLPDSLWAYTYPRNVLNRGELMENCNWEYCYELAEAVYPTPLYETFMSLVIFLILWSLRKHLPYPGMIFFIYVFLSGVERWYIEKIRINDKINVLSMELTQAEIISICFILVGIVGVFITYKKGKNFPNLKH